MSANVKQPVGQKRLTNVAVVRMRRTGKRFEIACYKNKVLSWRSGVEKDIDEVLQTHSVFSNVGKGTMAKSKELIEAFGTDDEEAICRLILEKGELQVSDKERESHVSSQFRDIATIVMEKTVNPDTERPYTMTMVEKFIHDVHFSVDPHRGSKQQALELIQKLSKRLPIARAKMELKFSISSEKMDALKSEVLTWGASLMNEMEANGTFSAVSRVDPGHYRQCDSLMRELGGRLEVVSLSVQKEGDSELDAFDTADDEETNPYGSSATILPSAHLSTPTEPAVSVPAGKIGKKHNCGTCVAGFDDAKEYREHFKGEWHKFNLKRKLKGLGPVTESDWEADKDIMCVSQDMDEFSLK